MQLHLLRHAKTHPDSVTGKDRDRRINAKGIAQSQKLAIYFQQKLQNMEVWCSDATRTRQTLEIIGEKRKFTAVEFSEALYLATQNELLQLLWNRTGSDDLLIVGHNYGISEVASYLTGEFIELKTGGYLCIEFDSFSWNEISQGLGSIIDRYRPRVDPSLFAHFLGDNDKQ